MDQQAKKLLAAKASLDYLPPGSVLGVGTGSTVNELIDLLPSVRDRIESLVSSSRASTERLEKLGFEVSTLNSVGDVDVYIDGADEATGVRARNRSGQRALGDHRVTSARRGHRSG